jgi:hypothetical protein
MQMANYVVRFFLELSSLVALGFWGYGVGAGPTARIVFAIVAPLLGAVFWGLLVAPKAPTKLPQRARMLLGLVVFGAATAGLYGIGHTALAIAFGATALVSTTLMIVWRQE